MKYIILTLVLICSISMNCQTLYKGFEYGMSKDEVKSEWKQNKEEYSKIDLGANVIWRTFKNRLFISDDKLYAIQFTPKNSLLGMDSKEITRYLNYSKEAFLSLGYEVLYEAENWNFPEKFDSKKGIVLTDPSKSRIIEIHSTSVKSYGKMIYRVQLNIHSYDRIVNQSVSNETKIENSGF